MPESEMKTGAAGTRAEEEQASEASGWTEPGAADAAPVDPFLEIERLESEKADLTDRLIRLAAEMDNLRKRSERETKDAQKYAVTKFAGDMLVVGDSLKRALESVPADRRESGDEVVKSFSEGVEMTAREMDRLLERNGIKRIAAMGERFDPHRHQAMFEVPDESVPAGTVVHVAQEGYQIGDRVLRAALVGVSKGGPDIAAAVRDAPAD